MLKSEKKRNSLRAVVISYHDLFLDKSLTDYISCVNNNMKNKIIKKERGNEKWKTIKIKI